MAALIALVCTTRFSDLLCGMEKMGMPQILVNQLGFLYRYIFVLIDKAHHILRARASRKLRNLGFAKESSNRRRDDRNAFYSEPRKLGANQYRDAGTRLRRCVSHNK